MQTMTIQDAVLRMLNVAILLACIVMAIAITAHYTLYIDSIGNAWYDVWNWDYRFHSPFCVGDIACGR